MKIDRFDVTAAVVISVCLSVLAGLVVHMYERNAACELRHCEHGQAVEVASVCICAEVPK